jgi:hypothetical protein
MYIVSHMSALYASVAFYASHDSFQFSSQIFFKRRYEMPQKHIQHSCVAHPMYPELYKCNSILMRIKICRVLRRWNQFICENNFIDSLGRDSNPDSSALKLSEYTTTPSTSSRLKKIDMSLLFF